MRSFCWFALVLACLGVVTESRNPGFKARITSHGLKYANDVAIQALKKNVEKTRIPDQSGKASGFKYSIKNIRVTTFNPPSSSIDIVPAHGLQWKAANAYIAVHGDFHYKKWFVSDGGSFDAKVSGVSFDLGINLGEDKNGRPSISTRQCSSSISHVDFKFHGGMSWLYNLFRDKVGHMIKDTLNSQMCKLITKEINEDGEKKFQDLKVTTPLAKKFLLDYRLTQAPAFQTAYLETFHKGEIYWLTEPNVESPIVAPVMPEPSDTSNMLYLFVSDYMFNTIGYVAQKHGFLKRNLTANDLPKSSRGVLNTTCTGLIPKCIGRLIAGIGDKYPHQQVDLSMTSTLTPNMTIDTSGVKVSCAGQIDLHANKPGTSERHFLVTLFANMSTVVNISMGNELLYAKIHDLNLKLKPGKSDVGPISSELLNFLINEALKVVLIPQLNDLGAKGFPLPTTKEFQFTNSKLKFLPHTVQIGTDIKYTAEADLPRVTASQNHCTTDCDDQVLRFEPSTHG